MLKNVVEVLTLFLIPVGGGIPAGVLLAKNRGIAWPLMSLIYLVSDIILAFVFEFLMIQFIRVAKYSRFLTLWAQSYKENLRKKGIAAGMTAGPFSLIMISFGIDPMTGRTAARLAGHGFVSGWAIAICGDMVFFALIAGSTLALNGILGDGTWTAVIIMAAMIGIPALIRRWKKRI